MKRFYLLALFVLTGCWRPALPLPRLLNGATSSPYPTATLQPTSSPYPTQTTVPSSTVYPTYTSVPPQIQVITLTPTPTLPPSPTAPPFPNLSAETALAAFRQAGLPLSGLRPMQPGDYAGAPQLALEAGIFSMPAICPDCKGWIMSFDNRDSLEQVASAYQSGALPGWLFMRGNLLLHLAGELTAVRAQRYAAVLENLPGGPTITVATPGPPGLAVPPPGATFRPGATFTSTPSPFPTATTASPATRLSALNPPITLVSMTGSVRIGDTASITIRTIPGVACDIAYQTPSGRYSHASGLKSVTANSQGICSWVWNIGSGTTLGNGRITIIVANLSKAYLITITS